MLARGTGSFLNKLIPPAQARCFSTAAGINARFEAAYQAKNASAASGKKSQ